MSREPITVWWSGPADVKAEQDWNILYREPLSLLAEWLPHRTTLPDDKTSMFQCPSFKTLARSTFVVRNPLRSEYVLSDGHVIYAEPGSLGTDIAHEPQTFGSQPVVLLLSHTLFAEEPVNMRLSSPWFHDTPYMRYGAILPGRVDVGQWFRPMNAEIALWPGQRNLIVEEDEPLMYLSFETDRRVVLRRFAMTQELVRIATACWTSPHWEPHVPLAKRYRRFRESKMRERVLRLVRENEVSE